MIKISLNNINWNITKISMNKCEHGESITLFCVNERCSWRDAGGCTQCVKKYHNHSVPNDTLSQSTIQELFRKMIIRPDIKMKSRSLQQAMFNYFMIMKSQISSSLDAVSLEINNRLGYPFLQKEGQLGVFRKIKNHEFKKITKVQLINFYKLATSIEPAQLQQRQRILYLQEVDKISSIIQKINEIFLNYSKAITNFDSSFSIQKTFYDKIQDICATVNDTLRKLHQNQNEPQKQTNKTETSPVKHLLVPPELNNYYHRDRNRKVSFDWGNNFEEKEKQMQAQKKRLMNMMKQNDEKKSLTQNIVKIKVQIEQQQSSQNDSPQQNKDEKNQLKREFSSHQKTPFTSLTSANHVFSDHTVGDILAKGITEMFAHTNLPRQASRKKLYDEGIDIQEKKIKVEMKSFDNDLAECSSPILKKRKQKKLLDGLRLEKVESDKPQEFKLNLKEIKTPQKNQEQQIVMKDKEAESVALLISSLTLPAQKAIPHLQAALKHANNNLSAAQYLSYLYLQIGKPKQCLDLCNDILEQLVGSHQQQQLSIHISNNKAAALNMLGRYSQSISILEKCIAYSQKDIYYKNLGDAFFSIGIYEKAIYNYEKAIGLNKNLDEALYNLSVCHFMQQHLYEAKLNVIRALKLSPKNQNYNQLHRQIILKIPN